MMGMTHIRAPMPGRPTLLAATHRHCGVSEAMGIDPHCTHQEPVGRWNNQREKQGVEGKPKEWGGEAQGGEGRLRDRGVRVTSGP
jgi:hypothetical protein